MYAKFLEAGNLFIIYLFFSRLTVYDVYGITETINVQTKKGAAKWPLSAKSRTLSRQMTVSNVSNSEQKTP